jgi:hypothetical protein
LYHRAALKLAGLVDDLALEKSSNEQAGREKTDERYEVEQRYVMMADVKERPLQKCHFHVG